MTRFPALTTCLLFSTFAYSQNFSISIESQSQIAYIGLDNNLSCTIEGISCDSISLSTDNGTLTKISSCKYVFRPSKIADSKIVISRKANDTTLIIGEHFFMVRDLPNPIASIGGLNGGPISKRFLNAQQGVAAYLSNNFGIDLKYQVKNFFILAIRNKEILFSKYIEGNTFTNEVHKLFDTLKKSDVITFSLIMTLKANGRYARANSLEFVIE